MPAERVTVADLIAELTSGPSGGSGRRLIGVTGAPGAGKSTLVAALLAGLGPRRAVEVPMDGFHLANEVLLELGRRDRKGAPDTFDAAGYAELLGRVRRQPADGPVIYAPRFHRDLEEPVAGSIPVSGAVPLVLAEGNYLLHDEDAWPAVTAQLDEVWYVCADDDLRHERLIDRRLGQGTDRAEAERWVYGSDEDNARTIAAGAERADRLLAVAPLG